MFDKKYKIVLECNFDKIHYDRLVWINENSNGMVDIKFPEDLSARKVYFAFEREDDATFFKIKYGS